MRSLLLLILGIQLLLAAPAFHGKRTFTQPDGTQVTYRLQGDEHLNWMESESGNILLYSKKNRRLEFAEIRGNTLKASGVPFSGAAAAKSASAVKPPKISKEELRVLHKKRRDEHLSKMKSRHSHH
ncbi:MAG: hypothetical protein MUP09_03055 [Thiovulaceae bacterium]|nr:hypothetical protein [Sulfurimonadaceae bacterium]